MSLAVNKGFTTSFFDLDGCLSFDGAETEKERMCNVNSRNLLSAAICVLALTFCAATTTNAATINVTYTLTGLGTGRRAESAANW
jgi:hypothetical protein